MPKARSKRRDGAKSEEPPTQLAAVGGLRGGKFPNLPIPSQRVRPIGKLGNLPPRDGPLTACATLLLHFPAAWALGKLGNLPPRDGPLTACAALVIYFSSGLSRSTSPSFSGKNQGFFGIF